MIIDNLNLNHLRIFLSVYRTKSMTQASKDLHLTQSGVSQHMRALEEMLDTKLFDRIKQKLVPTTDATELYNECSKSLYNIEETLRKIKGEIGQISGTVRIGITVEFGKNIILPILSEFGSKNPLVNFKIKMGFASQMNKMLLDGDIDFAFIDEYAMDSRIYTKNVYNEVLGLYINKKLLKNETIKNSKRFFESLPYVAYEEGEPMLHSWFAYHLNVKNINLNVRSYIMDVQGVTNLILNGTGAGILPGHHVALLGKKASSLYLFEGKNKDLVNEISIAYLKEKTHSLAVSAVMNYLIEKL